MRIEIAILLIGGLMVYNVYTDGQFLKRIMSYKKYYTIAGIVAGALLLCWLFRRNPVKAHQMLHSSQEYLKYLPVDAGAASLLTPILDFTAQRPGWSPAVTAALDSPVAVIRGGSGDETESPQRRFKRAVSESKKRYVSARQNWKCAKCQMTLPATYEIDHVVRLDRGGSNHVDNLESLCPSCHREKTLIENL